MKKFIISAFAAAALLVANSAVADHHGKKEVTLKGEAKCAKCALGESKKCADVLQVKGKDGKTMTYWIAKNDVSKDFHSNVCQSTAKLTAVGAVGEIDGKKVLVASKLKVEK
jgi:hypothetical protein